MDKTVRMSAQEFRRLAAGEADIETIQKNRASNDRGRIFENLLMKGAQYYANKGYAVINKVYEPYMCMKIIGGGKFIGQFIGRAEPDFKGVIRGGGAIAFEAKSTQKNRIQRNVLTDEQMQWLDEQWRMGAVALVCVQIQDKFFSVPWKTWESMKDIYGRKFLMAADIPEYEVVFDGAVRFLEYINGRVLF